MCGKQHFLQTARVTAAASGTHSKRFATVMGAVAMAAMMLVSGFCCKAAQPPNIVFILLDDFGWRDLHCYGSDFYQSPNIDKLAERGMKFTQAYAACPVCSPTRASILTGKYPARVKVTDWLPGRADRPDQMLKRPKFFQQLPLEEVTVAEMLKTRGYTCGAFGKWHLGGRGFMPEQQGFDYYFAGNQRGGDPDSKDAGKGEYGLTSAAVDFVEKNKSKPFFVYLAYYSVHIPLAARHELVDKYKALPPGEHQTNSLYAAMIESMDTCVGRMIDKLHALKLDKNTVVVFFSDNGGLAVHEGQHTPATSNFPLREGKGYLHEGGIREPLIVVWPGVVKPGSVCETPVCSVDFFPTFKQIANVPGESDPNVDGTSILPLLNQTGAVRRDALYWHYPHYSNQGGKPGGAIRAGDLKLIENYEDGSFELYNLNDDLSETNNLAEKMPAKALELEGKLDQWRRSVQAQMMEPNPDYDGTPAGNR
jgi:arylsulfatase A